MLTAINAMSSGRRPALRAASATRSRTAAMFSEMDMAEPNSTPRLTPSKLYCREAPRTPSLSLASYRVCGRLFGFDSSQRERSRHIHYMIAVGGAGSFGSPALEIGTRIMRIASPTITTTPAM